MTNTARQPTAAETVDGGARRSRSKNGARPDAEEAAPDSADPSRPRPAAIARQVWSRIATWSRTTGAVDTAVCVVYLCFAVWLFAGLWPDPATRAIADNANDQVLIEWFLAHGVLVWQGDFSFVTDRLNAPEGVNLLSNASHILHGVLMAPVTALFGAPVSFAVLVSVNLAATAAGWYLLFARTLGFRRWAAIIGGLFTGFAPGMISQSNSHLHMTAQWLVPPIVYCVIRLTRVRTTRAVVLTAVGLGLLITAQLFLGEEVLYLTALVLLLFAIAYALSRRAWAREIAPRFLAGMSIAGGVAVALLAYPLWIQLAGPQHIPNAPFAARFFFADIASFLVFSPLSIAGSQESARLATSSAEYNTFLGLPLILLVLACIVWQRRSPLIVAAGVTAILMAYLSMGPHLNYDGKEVGFPSLYGNIAEVPVVDGALPTRYALALIPLIAIILTATLDAAAAAGGPTRLVATLATVAALVPLVPMHLATTGRAPVPTFISSGAWRQCVPDGGVMVPVPLPTAGDPDLMRWPIAANAAFGIPEGFFIGPYGPGGQSSIGIYPRPTSQLLTEVAKTGRLPAITAVQREQARQDLAYWKADCVAVAHVPNEPALRTALEQLLGPGQQIADTWTWRIAR